MLVFGIITLVKGSFPLSQSRVVQGVPARVIGALLCVPLVFGQGIELIMGAMWGVEQGMQGREVNFVDAVKELQTKALVINAVAVVVPLLIVVVIAISTAQPASKTKARRRHEDNEYDEEDIGDRPRRRPRDQDDEIYDDRPRPPTRRDDEEPPDPGDDRIQDRPRR